jgi:hypothetical protein
MRLHQYYLGTCLEGQRKIPKTCWVRIGSANHSAATFMVYHTYSTCTRARTRTQSHTHAQTYIKRTSAGIPYTPRYATRSSMFDRPKMHSFLWAGFPLTLLHATPLHARRCGEALFILTYGRRVVLGGRAWRGVGQVGCYSHTVKLVQ